MEVLKGFEKWRTLVGIHLLKSMLNFHAVLQKTEVIFLCAVKFECVTEYK
jgi:hypothetical protein